MSCDLSVVRAFYIHIVLVVFDPFRWQPGIVGRDLGKKCVVNDKAEVHVDLEERNNFVEQLLGLLELLHHRLRTRATESKVDHAVLVVV